MMFVVRDLLRQPASVAIVVLATIVFILARTRFARWSLYASPGLHWFCADAGRFDGQRHLTNKLDATSFVWISSVELRAVGGLAMLLLAAPLGAAAGRLVRAQGGALWGLSALGPAAAGLLTSSVLLVTSFSAILAMPDQAVQEKLETLRSAVGQSDAILASGTVLSIVTCTTLAFGLLRAPSMP